MSYDQLNQALLARITDKAEAVIREVISTTLSEEIGRALTRALTEGEFYRSVSADLQDGLKTIYREISAATSGNQPTHTPVSTDTNEIFSEASRQLQEIFQTTEKATESIMTWSKNTWTRTTRPRPS